MGTVGLRQAERHGLGPRVEQQEHLSARSPFGAFDQHPQLAAVGIPPAVEAERAAPGVDPAYLGGREELWAIEYFEVASQRERSTGEVEKLPVPRVERPIDPGDGVVLAVSVVVATLGAAQLVAVREHRHAQGHR
jgi:hypothetical protein